MHIQACMKDKFSIHGHTIYHFVHYIPYLEFPRKKETKKTIKGNKEKNA